MKKKPTTTTPERLAEHDGFKWHMLNEETKKAYKKEAERLNKLGWD